ncbi:MAG TPA: thiolase family protein [Bacillota bacterium]|nr:thiolase family protein [Bacillota bacterium]
MRKAVITSFARTPIGAYLGGLREVPVQDLASLTIKEAVKRSDVGNERVDGVVFGQVKGTGDCANLGRVAALLAGLGEETPGYTVNRICGSGIQAVISAALEIQTGHADIMIAGGAESLSRSPYYLPLSVRYEGLRNGTKDLLCMNTEYHKNCQPTSMYPPLNMGLTGENVVALHEISREDQDLFSYQSQMKAKAAMENGRFAEEIVPVEIKGKKDSRIVSVDEHPRPNTTLEALAKLKPAFKEGGTITAGNSSGMNDAAAALVVMSEEKCMSLGLRPLAYVVDYAVHSINPEVMGLGPVGAIQKLLARTKLKLEDIDLLEINEAFAGQVLGCLKELGNYMGSPLYDRLNVNGGAVALGHPLGMSGARIVGTIAHEFKYRDARYGIASACIGGGQGLALLLENPKA